MPRRHLRHPHERPAGPFETGRYVRKIQQALLDEGLALTVDAMLHPRADVPYSDFGVPAIDPASWVADLGIGAVWAEQNGVPDAPIVLPPKPDGSADADGYYQMSAPDPDLSGDIDGINIAQIMSAGESLSSALVRYYVDGKRHRACFASGSGCSSTAWSATRTRMPRRWLPRL